MKINIKKYKPLILPSNDIMLKKFIDSNKVSLMEGILNSIEFAIVKNLPVAEVFGFENSEFIITLKNTFFEDNMNQIYDYYISIEKYELCKRIIKIREKIKKPHEEKTKV